MGRALATYGCHNQLIALVHIVVVALEQRQWLPSWPLQCSTLQACDQKHGRKCHKAAVRPPALVVLPRVTLHPTSPRLPLRRHRRPLQHAACSASMHRACQGCVEGHLSKTVLERQHPQLSSPPSLPVFEQGGGRSEFPAPRDRVRSPRDVHAHVICTSISTHTSFVKKTRSSTTLCCAALSLLSLSSRRTARTWHTHTPTRTSTRSAARARTPQSLAAATRGHRRRASAVADLAHRDHVTRANYHRRRSSRLTHTSSTRPSARCRSRRVAQWRRRRQ